MADEPNDLERMKSRRETQDNIRNWLTFVLGGVVPVLGAALGFSPLVKIWTFVPLLAATVLLLVTVWLHGTGRKPFPTSGGTGAIGRGISTSPFSRRSRFVQGVAVIALIFGGGAWVGSSGRDAFTLAMYGSLGDLAITPGRNMSDPAVISLRTEGNIVCFYTSATFNVRNATSNDVLIGAISTSLAMSADANAPIFLNRNLPDITQGNAGISGVALIKGKLSDWSKDPSIKTHLTTLRRGTDINVTLFQNRNGNETCLYNQDNKTVDDFKATTVNVSGELVMIPPDGVLRQENIGANLPVKVAK